MKTTKTLLIILFFTFFALDGICQEVSYSAFETEADKVLTIINTIFWIGAAGIFLFGVLTNLDKIFKREWVEFLKTILGYMIGAVVVRIIYNIIEGMKTV